MDRLINEGCDTDSGKEHEERMQGGERDLIAAAGVPTIVPCTHSNNHILNLETSRDPGTKARRFRKGFKLQQSPGQAAASEPTPG